MDGGVAPVHGRLEGVGLAREGLGRQPLVEGIEAGAHPLELVGEPRQQVLDHQAAHLALRPHGLVAVAAQFVARHLVMGALGPRHSRTRPATSPRPSGFSTRHWTQYSARSRSAARPWLRAVSSRIAGALAGGVGEAREGLGIEPGGIGPEPWPPPTGRSPRAGRGGCARCRRRASAHGRCGASLSAARAASRADATLAFKPASSPSRASRLGSSTCTSSVR